MSRIPAWLVAAALAFVAALLVLGATLAGALSIEPPSASAPAAQADAHPVVANAPTTRLSGEALLLAVEHDPFRPDRQRAPERYRMPGEEPPVDLEPPPPPPPPPFRLIGTAVSPSGSVAVIELENSSRMLEIGEEMLGYRLTSVEPERATMENGEQRVDLPLTSSLAAVASARDQRRSNRMQPNSPDYMRPTPDRGAAAERARELIERIRQSGGNVPPELLEQLRRLQAEGRNVDVQVEPGRFMIRTRPDTTATRPPRAPEP
jgi:hypothetical protein